MHPYATNSAERTIIPLYIAGMAIAIAWLIASLPQKERLPFWIEVPGTATLYALLLGWFRDGIWKIAALQKAKIVKVRNMAGIWHGYVTSSFEKSAAKHPVVVDIRQNWTHMAVKLRAEHSESSSMVACIYVGIETILSYQYENVPKPGAKETMHAHEGTAVLRLSDDGLTLRGEYYSGRDRSNYGELILSKH